LQANLAVQEAKYESAMKDLNNAQAELDDKQQELDTARAFYDQAIAEKQASFAGFVVAIIFFERLGLRVPAKCSDAPRLGIKAGVALSARLPVN